MGERLRVLSPEVYPTDEACESTAKMKMHALECTEGVQGRRALPVMERVTLSTS